MDEQTLLNDIIKMLANQIGFGGIFFMIAVIGPFSEEIAFRLWGIGRRWAYLVSALFVLAFAGSELGFLWGAVAAAGILTCAFAVKEVNLRTTIMTWLTSAVFAVCHFDGYSGFSISMALGLVSIFGMALVLNYLTIHHSWGLAVLLHMLNNGIACYGIQDEIISLCKPHAPITITTNAYDITLVPGAIKDAGNDTSFQYMGVGTAAFIAQDIINAERLYTDSDANSSAIHQYADIDYVHANNETYIMTLQNHDGQDHLQDALQLLKDSGMVTLDTILEPVYVVTPTSTADTLLRADERTADNASTLTSVCQYLFQAGIYALPAAGMEQTMTALSPNDLEPYAREYAKYSQLPLPQFQKKAEDARRKMMKKVTSAGITVKKVADKQARHIIIH